MKSVILACVVLLSWLAPAEAQYLVPNMSQPYGGNWYWSYPVVPQPYYYGGGYYGGHKSPSYRYRSGLDRHQIESDLYWNKVEHDSTSHHHHHGR